MENSKNDMNLRALWLLFAQATVVFMAAAFVAAGFWRLFMSPSSYSAAIARVMPSVVSIYGRDGGEINSVGAGIIVSHDGDILTNYHLVADRETVEVELGGKERHIATIAGIDPEIDLAVLRISTSTKLPAISFAITPRRRRETSYLPSAILSALTTRLPWALSVPLSAIN